MLSQRQQDTYRFIRHYFAEHGKGPLLSEIALGLGIRSKGVVHRYLQALVEEGLIRTYPGRHRGIELRERHSTLPTVPLLGTIAAGRPIEAIAGHDEINLAEFFVGEGRFALKVQGESMVEAGILDGDLVVIERTERADDGAIVVALIDGEEATLKRFYNNHNGSVTLKPENSTLSVMVYPAKRVQIQGVVVGQMRSYR